jgi:putative aldouronate transport system permease protein
VVVVKRMSKEDRIFKYISSFVIITVFLVVLIPLLNLLAVSLSGPTAIVSGKVYVWPVDFHINAYRYVLSSKQFFKSFQMSLALSIVGSILGIIVTIAAAYPLSKRHLPGRNVILLAFVFTTMFSGGIIPGYMLIRSLKLFNTIWALILPGIGSVFNLLIAKSYFESIPEEIEESAKIDGASYTMILLKIMLPIAVPVIAVIVLFYAVGFWNEYFNARLYITESAKMPLQLYLQTVITASNDPTRDFGISKELSATLIPQNITNATIIIAMLPVMAIYPFLQRYFISGIMIGSVKG